MNTQCSIALLESALSGNLRPNDEDLLNRHLEECEECCAALERMAGGAAWCHEAAALLVRDEIDTAVPAYPRAGGEEWSPVDFTVEHLEPADDPNALGRLGGYDVLEIIGHGGMGVVLKAFDRELKRCVAIKVLAPHLAHSSQAKDRFAREARAAAAVVHPNVLAIHQVHPNGPLPFLVMPLIAGESLAQRLTAQGRLELKEVLRIGMQAAAGLSAAHEQGLVHRDVKPANILLDKGVERAVLTDFGLARAADDVTLTRWGVIAGTPQYMSPEQARGEQLDGRSDLFSLGCVLYEMATGVSPFRTDSMMATMRRLVDDPPQSMASLNPELPPWFIAIVDRLLEKDPSRRFNTAKEVSELLERCLAHLQQPTSVPLPADLPKPAVRRTWWPPVFRFKGVLIMIAALGVSLLGVLLLSGPTTDIAGQWSGEEWGQVVLKKTSASEYTGTYSDTDTKHPGEIRLKWSRIERQFTGTWREGDDRFGHISAYPVGDDLRVAFGADACKINPDTPHMQGMTWTRAKAAEPGDANNDPRVAIGKAIQREVGRQLKEGGARYDDLQVSVAEQRDNSVPFAVQYLGLCSFKAADGTSFQNANGEFIMAYVGGGRWQGSLAGTRFTVSAGRTDNIDLPFVDDPSVLGRWQSVDLVAAPSEFNPDKPSWKGSRSINEIAFLQNGKTSLPGWTWTKDVVISRDDQTASRYETRVIQSKRYMFLEWKSGEVMVLGRKPAYYVLRWIGIGSREDSTAAVEKAVKTISTCAEGDLRVATSLATLREFDGAAVVKQLAPFLDSKEPAIRRAAIYILWKGKFADVEPVVPSLLRLCEHEEDLTRGMAALALGGNRAGGSLAALTKMTDDDRSGYARRCAAIALGFLGNPVAIGVLEKALNDPEALVRANAQAALAMLRQKTDHLPAKPIFSPVMDRVLPMGAPCRQQYFQIRTGEVFVVGRGPATTKEEFEKDSKKLDDAGGADFTAGYSKEGVQLVGRGCIFSRDFADLKWDTFTAEQVVDAIKRVTFSYGVIEPRTKEFPITYLFKTARGDVGMMEILGVSEDERGYHGEGQKGHGLKFRYKLIVNHEATPPERTAFVSRTFPLRFKLASDMAEDLRQILLSRPGHEAKPSSNNREIAVTVPADVMPRVQTFITVMDWPDTIMRGSNYEYPRDTVLHAARSFFYACAIEDVDEVFSKLLSLQALSQLKGDTRSEAYTQYLFGGIPDPEWEKSLRGDWPGKKEAIESFVREWNRYPLTRITEDHGIAIGFGVKHFCSGAFDGAPRDFYSITIEPDRTHRDGRHESYYFSTLPPWRNVKDTKGATPSSALPGSKHETSPSR